jgi:hypothetical protein
VLEGSQSDPAPESSAEPEVTTPPVAPTEGEPEPVTTEERTPEQIEAIWKNRVAGKDKAHAAETATLRQQIADYEARLTTKQQQDLENMTEAEQWKAKAKAAEDERDAERQQRVLEVRQTKYTAAAENLDEATLASMDEAKLAALNARLTGDEAPPPPIMDPNTAPKRTSSPPASSRDKSVEELESDLKKHEPEFMGSLQG